MPRMHKFSRQGNKCRANMKFKGKERTIDVVIPSNVPTKFEQDFVDMTIHQRVHRQRQREKMREIENKMWGI